VPVSGSEFHKRIDLIRARLRRERESIPDPGSWFESIDYHPHPGQQSVHESRARFKVCCCGRRWGKSLAAAREAEPVILQPGTRTWVVAPTYDLTDKVFREIWNDMIIKQRLPTIRQSEREHYIKFAWGATVEGKSADNPDSLVGEGLDFLVVDEAAKIKQRVWEQYLRPTLTDRRGRALFISTPEGTNWFHDLYLRGQSPGDPDWSSWRFPSWTNPYLPPEDIEEARRTLDPDVFDQEYGAGFTVFAGQVYKNFDPAVHVVDRFPVAEGTVFRYWDAVAGVDFGYINPFVHLWGFVSPDGELYIYDEIYQSRRTVPELAAMIRRREADFPHAIQNWRFRICDPSDPGSRKQFAQEGIRMRPARPPLNDVREGIREVRNMLHPRQVGGDGGRRPRLFVFRRCKNLIREFVNYRYPDESERHGVPEEPLKKDDHAMDALRYMVRKLNRGRVEILR